MRMRAKDTAKGKRAYLYRAVAKEGYTIDFFLPPQA
jgi:transposase-like protein